jgi:hypothetical protein
MSTNKIETEDCVKAIVDYFYNQNDRFSLNFGSLTDAKSWKRLSKTGSGNSIKRTFQNKKTGDIVYVTSTETEILGISENDNNIITNFSNFTKDKVQKVEDKVQKVKDKVQKEDTLKDINKPTQTKISFIKQTMKMKIDWVAAKDFDVCYYYEYVKYPISKNDNGYNYLIGGYGAKLANPNKFDFLKKAEIEEMEDFASTYGGNPKPFAFTVSKGTKLEVEVKKYNYLTIKIVDGPNSGNEFSTSLLDFRTYLTGTPKDENLVISKYRIFYNGSLFKAKYYINMGRIKSALLSAFGFLETEADLDDDDDEYAAPEYISNYDDNMLSRNDCKHVQIMRYDNNSKIPVLVDFDVLKFYDETKDKKDLKKDLKKYNI